eukprot:10980583-Heterocapsa_arctica.AAC.1
MGIEKNKFGARVLSSKLVSISDVAQTDQRSAWYIMVIARMPEDRSKTFKSLQQPSKPYTP